MNCRNFLKRWRCIGSRSELGTHGLQGAMSLASLRGWWRRCRAQERQERREDHQDRPVTPWSHGLF